MAHRGSIAASGWKKYLSLEAGRNEEKRR